MGGMDSMQMVMPLSGCSKSTGNGSSEPYDLYTEFSAVRGAEMTLDSATLLPINTSQSGQPCQTFGLHPSLTELKALYDAGDATIVANMGALLEPIRDKVVYQKRDAEPPFGVFGHNTMQDHAATADASDKYAQGVLGRMVKALIEDTAVPAKAALYSIDGFQRMLEGARITPFTIDESDGAARFTEYQELAHEIESLVSHHSNSIFGETYAKLLKESIDSTEFLGAALENDTISGLNTTFG